MSKSSTTWIKCIHFFGKTQVPKFTQNNTCVLIFIKITEFVAKTRPTKKLGRGILPIACILYL